MHKSSLKI